MIADLSAISDRGLVRPNNEDVAWIDGHIVRDGHLEYIKEIDGKRPFFWAIADGVGGSAAGEIASMQVVEHLGAQLARLPSNLGVRQLGTHINSIAIDLNRTLIREGLLKDARVGMATTLSGLLCYEGKLFLLHAGDSRLYRFRDGELVQISRDHTLREFSGTSTIPGNILINCFGGDKRFFLDFVEVGLPRGRDVVLLLCSDGLSDMLPDRRIGAIMDTTGDNADCAADLVAQATAAGGHDNITLIIATLY